MRYEKVVFEFGRCVYNLELGGFRIYILLTWDI